jgi:hypothetical protein
MADGRQYPGCEIEEFFEAAEIEHHKAFADPLRRRITELLFEQPAPTIQPAQGGEVGPVPGERLYVFPGSWSPTDPNGPRKGAR